MAVCESEAGRAFFPLHVGETGPESWGDSSFSELDEVLSDSSRIVKAPRPFPAPPPPQKKIIRSLSQVPQTHFPLFTIHLHEGGIPPWEGQAT